jgi:hypothetical protein
MVYYTVPSNRENRLDLIANEKLGSASYAWVIAYFNHIDDGFTVAEGTKLAIPTSVTKLFETGELLAPVPANNLNLGSVIYPKYITAENIITYVRAKQASIGSNVETMYQLQDGQAEAIEFKVKDTPSINGIPLKDLKLKPGVIVSFIIHDGQLIIPTGTDCISEGDNVMIVTSHKGFTDLTDILQ